jgi:hypothetical protein
LSDVRLGNEIESDLYDLKVSALGQAILRDENIPSALREIAPRLREILQNV